MTVAGSESTDRDVVEFATFIRERPVTCHWVDGRVSGDPELMERLSHMSMPEGWTRYPARVARTISEAMANPVTIRLVRRHDVDLTRDVPAPPCVEPGNTEGTLGDYWIG